MACRRWVIGYNSRDWTTLAKRARGMPFWLMADESTLDRFRLARHSDADAPARDLRRKLSSNTPTFRTLYLKRSSCWNRKGANHLAPSLTLIALRSTNLSPTHSRRLATLVAQPVTIRLPLVSKISRATVSVNASPSILTSMTRVSLCVCIQTPAGLKTKASVTAL